MKSNVKIIDWHYEPFNSPGFTLKYIYFRTPKTFNEIRQNSHAKLDGYKVRDRFVPTSWDDLWPSQAFGRDWKRFTKNKKQWMK